MSQIDYPLVSVVIPTFNHAEYLRKAISSVLGQTYQNFEVIIVDNNSTDHTNEVIDSFDDSRLNFYKINNNGVIAVSRNYGVEKSIGKWVAFLDSDDYWYPTKLASLSSSLVKDTEYDVLSTHEYKFNKSTGKKKKLMYGPIEGDKYRSLLLYGNRLSPSASVVRREFLIEHKIKFSEKIEFVTVEDYDYWLQLALYDAKFKFFHRFEGEYLVHGINSSMNSEFHKSNELSLMKHHVFKIQEFELDKEKLWRGVLGIFRLRESFHLLKEAKIGASIQGMLNAFLSAPFPIIKWFFRKLEFFIKNYLRSFRS